MASDEINHDRRLRAAKRGVAGWAAHPLALVGMFVGNHLEDIPEGIRHSGDYNLLTAPLEFDFCTHSALVSDCCTQLAIVGKGRD